MVTLVACFSLVIVMKKQRSSFLVVSYTFSHFRMKRIINNKETGSLIQVAYYTKVNHATRVTTLQLKQPICFYSVGQCNYKHFELLITCHKGSIPGLQTSELELDPNSEAMHASISMMTEWQLLAKVAHPGKTSDYICS